MAGRPLWGTTPRQSIAAVCAARGTTEVIEDCVALLAGKDADPGLVRALAGPGAARFLDAPADQRYWLRVWGARGLLWALSEPGAPPADEHRAAAAIVGALGDEHWRVREMAAKVAARHRIDDAQPGVVVLLDDEIPRVRAVAARTLRLLSSG
jgi:hypothetical protein